MKSVKMRSVRSEKRSIRKEKRLFRKKLSNKETYSISSERLVMDGCPNIYMYGWMPEHIYQDVWVGVRVWVVAGAGARACVYVA